MPNQAMPPVYQLEVLEPNLGLASVSDVSLNLSSLVEVVRQTATEQRIPVRVESKRDARGELEGLAFFQAQNGDMLARITAYYLHRETVLGVPADVMRACEVFDLRKSIQALFPQF